MSLTLVQLSDPHVLPEGERFGDVIDTYAALAAALHRAQDFAPDAIIISGDLAQSDQGYPALVQLLHELHTPVYLLPGNHDNPFLIRRLLGRHGRFTDPDFLHYRIDDLPLTLLMLDTHQPDSDRGLLCAARRHWLQQQLDACAGQPVLLFMHHPPIDCGIPFMDALGLDEREAFLAMIGGYPNIVAIACGHLHRPLYAQLGRLPVLVAPSTAYQTPADFKSNSETFNLDSPALLLHRWSAEQGLVSHLIPIATTPSQPYPA